MKKLSIIFIILIALIISALWGYFQVKLFPVKDFGYLYIFTSFIGGYMIGYIISKLFLNKY
jgi:hypothetical protein